MPDAPDLARLAAQWAADPTTTLFAPLADALRKRGELSRAAELALQGTAACPDFLPGWLVLAAIRRDQDDRSAATEALGHARRLDRNHPLVVQLTAAADDAAPDSHPAGASQAGGTPEPAREQLSTLAAPSDAGELQDGGSQDAEPERVDDDLMFGDEVEALDLEPATDQLASISLALLYQGQGHLELAVQVLDALVARDPGDHAAGARRDAIRAELDSLRPPSYRADPGSGRSVRQWLSLVAHAAPPATAPPSSFDAFYQPPAEAPTPRPDDFAAFQAWLKELDR
jgi:hypothetical protein